ncbi:hypothetical protein ABXJ00_00910, partial [Herbaspirillum seropedicae]
MPQASQDKAEGESEKSEIEGDSEKCEAEGESEKYEAEGELEKSEAEGEPVWPVPLEPAAAVAQKVGQKNSRSEATLFFPLFAP